MNIAIQTNEGKQLDLNNVKYMTFDNVEYALLPVIYKLPVPQKKVPSDEKINQNLEDFFGVTKTKRVHLNSTAQKVREWLTTAKPGQSTVLKAPSDYAIRVACEIHGVKAKIYKIKRGQFSVVYDRNKTYARMQTV
jgi:hypothetical protein